MGKSYRRTQLLLLVSLNTQESLFFLITELFSGMIFHEILVGKRSKNVKLCLIRGIGIFEKLKIVISDNEISGSSFRLACK